MEEVIAEMFAQVMRECLNIDRPRAEHVALRQHCIARAATWWTILRISLEERLVYRGDFALGTLMRFLPIVTQIFLWSAVFSAMDGRRQRPADRRLLLPRHHRLLPADDDQPGVFQHAGPGHGHRPRHPRRHRQEVPHPADRHAGVPVALPRGPQAGLLHRGGGRRSRWCFTSAAAISPAGPTARRCWPSGVAGDVVPAGLLPGGHAGHDRDSGSWRSIRCCSCTCC